MNVLLFISSTNFVLDLLTELTLQLMNTNTLFDEDPCLALNGHLRRGHASLWIIFDVSLTKKWGFPLTSSVQGFALGKRHFDDSASNSLMPIHLSFLASSWAVAEVSFWFFLGPVSSLWNCRHFCLLRQETLTRHLQFVGCWGDGWRLLTGSLPQRSQTLVKVSVFTTLSSSLLTLSHFRNCA